MNDKFWELEVDVNLVSNLILGEDLRECFHSTITLSERRDSWNSFGAKVHGQEVENRTWRNRRQYRVIGEYSPTDLDSHLHCNETCDSGTDQVLWSK